MLALLFLLGCVGVGHRIVCVLAPQASPLVRLAGAYLAGALVTGTAGYLLDLSLQAVLGSYAAGAYALFVALVLANGLIYRGGSARATLAADLRGVFAERWGSALFVAACIYGAWFTYGTFHRDGGDLWVAGAWNDAVYHHAFVRSILWGGNVPVEYPYFGGAAAHYHFLHQYFSSVLARLGLHSVDALNVPGVIAYALFLALVFEFGRSYFGSRSVGVLGALFFAFHGSLGAFPWLRVHAGRRLASSILQNREMMGKEVFENWGLFNLNVFINQRHLPFALAFVVLAVLVILSWEREVPEKGRLSIGPALVLGALVGLTPFWNSVAAGVMILFLFLFVVRYLPSKAMCGRILLAGLVAALLAYPQLHYFKSGGSVLAGYPRLHFGYGIPDASLGRLAVYYFQVIGVKTLFLIAGLCFLRGRRFLDLAIFLVPFVLANTFQFGKVLFDNNKLIFISLAFANCFAAHGLLSSTKAIPRGRVAVRGLLVATCVLAGLLEIFWVRNIPMAKLADGTSPLVRWIRDRTEPRAVFLTHPFIPWGDSANASVALSGRRFYVVRNNVDSTCDLAERLGKSRKIYTFDEGPEAVEALTKGEGIDYIVIDDLVRRSDEYGVSEGGMDGMFPLVFEEGRVKVYAVSPKKKPAGGTPRAF